jgi:hypothetical protein
VLYAYGRTAATIRRLVRAKWIAGVIAKTSSVVGKQFGHT